MRICVFGSSAKATPQKYLDTAFELGQIIAAEGHSCTNGGGKFGVMGSLSEGVRNQGGKVVGIIHEKFCIDGEEDTHTTDMIISHGPDLSERKQLLYDNGDCIIVLPGGVGTFDELWESVSSKSLGMKGLSQKPICILNIDGFYDGSIIQLKRAFDDKLLYLSLDKFFHVASTTAEALHWCVKTYNMSLNVPLEDISASRKSAKLPSKDIPKSNHVATNALEMLDGNDDRIKDVEFPSIGSKNVYDSDVRVDNTCTWQSIRLPLVFVSVGVILGYTAARHWH